MREWSSSSGSFSSSSDEYRTSFAANLVQNRSDPTLRSQGALHRRNAARLASWFIAERMVDQVTHPDPALAADFVFRALSSLAMQTVLFDDDEITSQRHDPETWVTGDDEPAHGLPPTDGRATVARQPAREIDFERSFSVVG